MWFNVVNRVPQWHLRWSEVPITFGRHDFLWHVPSPGSFPLIISPIIGQACLMKVLMDGGSGLNILYAGTLDRMGIPRANLCPGGAPFFGVIPRIQATPLRSIQLPITFRDPSNFWKEVLDFEVVDFTSPYHALLGRPCYTKSWPSCTMAA